MSEARQLADILFSRIEQEAGECLDEEHCAVLRAIKELAVDRHERRLARGFKPVEDSLSRIDLGSLGDLHVQGERAPLELVRHEVELVAFPDIYFRIREVLEEHASGAAELAKVVGADPSLAAKLLKIANSSFYGFPSGIESLERAITVIGAREVSMLALGIAAIDVFTDIPPELANMRLFWRHSVTCGILAKSLCRLVGGQSPERCFVGGLLHDMGRLLIYKEMPYAAVEILTYARENLVPTTEAEEIVLGYGHSLLGSLLLSEWALPRPICTILRHHHDPVNSPEPEGAALVQLADMMAHALFMGEERAIPLPPLSLDHFRSLELDSQDVQELAESFEEELDDMLSSLF